MIFRGIMDRGQKEDENTKHDPLKMNKSGAMGICMGISNKRAVIKKDGFQKGIGNMREGLHDGMYEENYIGKILNIGDKGNIGEETNAKRKALLAMHQPSLKGLNSTKGKQGEYQIIGKYEAERNENKGVGEIL